MPNDSKTILVADDNPALCSLLQKMFQQSGWDVRTASDGFAALAEMRMSLPDVLLSDLNMGGMSGFELLSVVRRRFPSVAVIAMSGAYFSSDIPAGIPADAFYAKGECSVQHLLELAAEARTGIYQQSLVRSSAPIWIPSTWLPANGAATVAFCCPECLRAVAHSASFRGAFGWQIPCYHCGHVSDIAVVSEESPSIDTTLSGDFKHASESTTGRAMADRQRISNLGIKP